MKRLLSLLLVLMFLFGACAVSHDVESSVTEDVTSASEPAPEESLPPPTEVFTDISVSADKYETVISNGKSYTVVSQAAETYPDTYNKELTDGAKDTAVTSFYHDSLAGYAARSQTVVIDLGEFYRNIHTLSAAYYIDDTAGISSELKINGYLSLDGEEWEKCGALVPQTIKIQSVNIAELELKNYSNARYVKFIITGNNTWIFLQELFVLADIEDKTQSSYVNALDNTYSSIGTVSSPQSGSEIDHALNKVNIAEGKRYTIDTPRNKDYIDVDGKKLTDGISEGKLSQECWVGFDGGSPITIKIDLGETANDISSVEASFYGNTALNNYLPTALKINALDASENRTELGVVYGSKSLQNGNFVFKLPFEKTISARYIEIVVYTVKDSLVLVEEITVNAYRPFEENALYPAVQIEKGGEADPNAKDEYKNLILNKPQQIDTAVNTSDFYLENNSPVTDKTLTDGVYSDEYNIHNGKFFKFYLGETRNIIYDLGHLSSVDRFTASFCHQEEWAMYAPEKVVIYASPDGTNWYTLGKMYPAEIDIEGIYRCELQLPQAILARHIAFSFAVTHWAGVDELQVFGNESVKNAVSAESEGYESVSADSTVNKRKEPSDDLLGGSRQLSLLYHNSSSGYTEDDLLPYVAYLDREGNIVDTMFDSFLFLHSTGAMPSGNTPYSGSAWSDWQWSIDDLFAPDENLAALNSAAGKVKSALNLPEDFTYKVSMTIYYPTIANCANFGDFDGDGMDDDFTLYSVRMAALRSYIDQIEKRFAEAGFNNIELVGYYWWHEDITSTPEDDITDLLNELADYIHSKNKDFFWIPYFTASGFATWDDYGFDIACMQPNYVFEGERPFSNLINNEKFTRYYGMGVEMEIFEGCLSDVKYFKRYMDYCRVGAETGYMTDTVNMYYQSFSVFRDACFSESSMARTVYDVTYEYIKGTLNTIPEKLADMSFETKCDTPVTCEIDYSTDKLIEVRLLSMPDHGSVTFDPDGSFTFYPEHGFEGETTFTFAYGEYLSFSEPITVTIIVE